MQFQTGAHYAGLQKLRHFYFQLPGRRWLLGLFRVLQHAQGGADLQISREFHRKSLTSCKSCTLLYPFRLFTSPMLPNPAGKNLPLPNSQVSIIDFCNFLHFSILLRPNLLNDKKLCCMPNLYVQDEMYDKGVRGNFTSRENMQYRSKSLILNRVRDFWLVNRVFWPAFLLLRRRLSWLFWPDFPYSIIFSSALFMRLFIVFREKWL